MSIQFHVMSCSQPRRAEAALRASCVQELGRSLGMEVGGYNVRYKVTRGWFQSEGVGEGHWYHVVWG